MAIVTEKSEILFLYESTYSIPNGDPFTGEQRYDEETKKVLVSDVRIKRFIRDYLISEGEKVFVWNDQSNMEANESGAAGRVKSLKKEFALDESVMKEVKKGAKTEKVIDALKLLTKCVDVRLFGGISTEEGDAVNLTGPVQFSLLSSSLNAVEMRLHQNTSQFVSKGGNKQGAIGTTTIVPYALLQIHGWINPKSAEKTNLTDDDVKLMFNSLWNSINDANTRTKSNQNATLLLQIIYSKSKSKIYGADRLISLDTTKGGTQEEKRGEQLRSIDDYSLKLDALIEASKSDKVKEIKFYTEHDGIKTKLTGKAKFTEMSI
jgi:CRISPR-associated protein Csh2